MRELVTIGDVLETREVDPEIRSMFDAFEHEHATWAAGDMPEHLTLDFMTALGEWIKDHPDRWRAFFLRYRQGLDIKKISRAMGVTERKVYRLLEPVHYSEMAKKIIDNK